MPAEPRPLRRRALLARAALLAGGTIAAAFAAPITGTAATPPPTPTPTLAPTAPPRTPAPAVVRRTPVTLRIARFGSDDTARYERELYADFAQLQPDIALDIYAVNTPDWNGYLDRIIGQIKSGNAPDAAFVATEGTQVLAGQGYAAPLDTYVMRDREELGEYFRDVAPVLIEAMMVDGHLYELPSDFNAAHIYYNAAALTAKGIPLPSDIWTKDDFVATATRATERTNGATRTYGFAWTNRLWGGAMPWFFVNDGNILTEEKVRGGDWLWQTFYKGDPAVKGRSGGWRWAHSRANDARNVEALQFLVDLTYRDNAAPPAAAADSLQSQTLQLFANRQLAMFASGAYSVSGVHDAKVPPGDYDVALMPKWRTRRHQLGIGGYVMLPQGRNKDATWEFLKYRIRKETIAATVKGGATTPARRSLATTDLWTPDLGPKNWRVFYDVVDTLPDTAPIPAPPQANEVTAIFTRSIGLAMTRQLSPQAALDRMHDELAPLFEG